MKPLFQIEIPRRSSYCARGGETLVPSMEYYSILLENPENGFHRHDFCPNCWENSAKLDFLPKSVSSWKSIVMEKKEKFIPQNRDEKILYLLKEALTQEYEDKHVEVFILALYLARRKKLLLRQELQREDGIFNLYEIADTEEMLCVKKFNLAQIQVEKIQLQLAKKLGSFSRQ